jgi:hypothetical protein
MKYCSPKVAPLFSFGYNILILLTFELQFVPQGTIFGYVTPWTKNFQSHRMHLPSREKLTPINGIIDYPLKRQHRKSRNCHARGVWTGQLDLCDCSGDLSVA